MNKIKIIEKNQPSQLAKKIFGEIVAKSILENLGIEECKKLIEIYKASEEKA